MFDYFSILCMRGLNGLKLFARLENLSQPILGQYSISISPENIWTKMG